MSAGTLYIAVKGDTKELVTALKSAQSMSVKFGSDAKTAIAPVGTAIDALKNSVLQLGSAWIGLNGIKSIIQISDQYTQLESRLKLVTTGTQNLADVQQKLYDASLRSHVGLAETTKLYTSIARATQDLGVTQAQTLQITETINQALIISGASAESSNAALIQLGQGLSSGVLRGEEFNSVMEQTPRLAQALANGLGVNIGQLREMAKEGALTSQVVTQALLSQKEVIEAEFGQMKQTIGQAWTDLTTVVQTFIHEADKSSDSTGAMVSSVKDLSSTIESNKGAILSLFSGITIGAAGALEGISGIVRSLQGLAIVAASPDKHFIEWMFATREDMKTWQAEIGNGTAFIKDRIAELAEKKDEVNRRFVFTDAAKQSQLEESALIDKQTAALRLQIDVINGKANALAVAKDSFMHLAELEQEDARQKGLKSTTQQDTFMVNNQWAIDNAAAVTAAEDKFYTEKENREQKATEEAIKENEKRAAEIEKLDQKMTEAIIKNSDSRYQLSVDNLRKEIAGLEEYAGKNQAMLDKVHEYEKGAMIAMGEFKDMYSTREQERIKKITDSWQVNEETKFELTKEQYEKQKALTAEMDAYFENSEDNKLAVEMSRLAKSYSAKMRAAEGDMDLQDKVKDWYIRQQKEIEDKHNYSLQKMKEAWKSFGHDVENSFTSVLTSGLKGEFDSIGDAWSSLTDKMYNAFIDMVAKMVVAWATSQISSFFGGSSTISIGEIGSWISGLFGDGGGQIAANEAAYFANAGSSGGSSSSSGGSGVLSTASTAMTLYGLYDKGTKAYNYLANLGNATPVADTGGQIAANEAAYFAEESTPIVSEAAPVVGEGSGVLGMTASEAGIVAGMILWGLEETYSKKPDPNEILQSSRVTPSQLAAVAGTDTLGTLTQMTYESSQALGMLSGTLATATAMSVDAANGVVVFAHSMGGGDESGGLSKSLEWSTQIFNNATGVWEYNADAFKLLLEQMEEINPVTDEAIKSSAEYVAQMAGLPYVADELAQAFVMTQQGITDFADGTMLASGTIGDALGVMSGAAGDFMTTVDGVLVNMSSINWETVSNSDGNHDSIGNYDPGNSLAAPAASIAAVTAEQSSHSGDMWGDGGMADGGVVSKLIVPRGDHGFGPLKFGEGVIDVDTMKILSSSIRSGKFPESGGNSSRDIADLKEVLISLGMTITNHLRKSEKIMNGWDRIGLPTARA